MVSSFSHYLIERYRIMPPMWKTVSEKWFQGKGNILHNRVLLYVVFIASLVNQLSYALLQDYTTPLIFVLVGIITTSFSKNMIVILTMSLVTSNILKFGTKIRLNEGMSSTKANLDDDDDVVKDKEEDSTNKKVSKKEKFTPEASKSSLDPAFMKEA